MSESSFRPRTGRLIQGETFILGRRKFSRGKDYDFTADEFAHMRDNASFQFDAVTEENDDVHQSPVSERSEADPAGKFAGSEP